MFSVLAKNGKICEKNKNNARTIPQVATIGQCVAFLNLE